MLDYRLVNRINIIIYYRIINSSNLQNNRFVGSTILLFAFRNLRIGEILIFCKSNLTEFKNTNEVLNIYLKMSFLEKGI